jgi:hypothetical protein
MNERAVLLLRKSRELRKIIDKFNFEIVFLQLEMRGTDLILEEYNKLQARLKELRMGLRLAIQNHDKIRVLLRLFVSGYVSDRLEREDLDVDLSKIDSILDVWDSEKDLVTLEDLLKHLEGYAGELNKGRSLKKSTTRKKGLDLANRRRSRINLR